MKTKRDAILGRISAIGAAMAYGTCSVLIRQGVDELTSPLVGASIAMLSGTIAIGIISAKDLGNDFKQSKRSIFLLLVAGVAAGLGILASYLALSMTRVVIVSPLQSTIPLFAILLSHFFLGKLERITFRAVTGTILVIVGATLITFFRVA